MGPVGSNVSEELRRHTSRGGGTPEMLAAANGSTAVEVGTVVQDSAASGVTIWVGSATEVLRSVAA